MEHDGSFIFHESNYMQSSFSAFQGMRMKNEFTDVVIKVRDREYPAHRVVLAARIPYFQKFGSIEDKIIVLNELDPYVMEAVINFAYEGKLKITEGNVQQVFFATVCLQLHQIQQMCLSFLAKRFSSNSDPIASPFLKVIPSDEYIRQNFDEFSKTEEFLFLPYYVVKDIFSADDLTVTNEEKVFEALIKWTKVSLAERQHLLPYLLAQIRMNYLTSEFLIERVGAEGLIKMCEQCRYLVEEVKNCHLLKKRKMSLSFKTNPRLYMETCRNVCESITTVTDDQSVSHYGCLSTVTASQHVQGDAAPAVITRSERILQVNATNNVLATNQNVAQGVASAPVSTNQNVAQGVAAAPVTMNQNVAQGVAASPVTVNQNVAQGVATAPVTESQNVAQGVTAALVTMNQAMQKGATTISTSNQNVRKSASTISTPNQNVRNNVNSLLTSNQNVPHGNTTTVKATNQSSQNGNIKNSSAVCNVSRNLNVSNRIKHGVYALRSFSSVGSFVSYFDYEARRWNNFPKYTRHEPVLQAVCIRDQLYVFFLNTLETFSLVSHEWSVLVPMVSSIKGAGIASFGSIIYLFGGFSFPNIFQCFDTQKNKWLENGMMKYPCRNMSVVSASKCIFITGGYDSSFCNKFLKYHPITKQWTDLPAMKNPRADHGSAALNDKIYVCGGRNTVRFLNSIEVFDKSSNQWADVANPKVPRHSLSLVSWDNKLYVIGGMTEKENCFRCVDVYDLETNKWVTGPPVSPHDMLYHFVSSSDSPQGKPPCVIKAIIAEPED